MQNGCDSTRTVNHEMSKFIHGEKPAVFDAFHFVGSGLWTLWGITLKVYEYSNRSVMLITLSRRTVICQSVAEV